jgi:3-hydroxyacyl-CoA dehydrogenase
MKYQVNKIAVLGAGVMGSAIAAHFAGAGFKVLLLDMVPNILTDEEKSKKLTLNHEVIRNKLANLGKANILNPKSKAIYAKDLGDLIETGNFIDDMGKISDCDLIMEVIVENLDIKRDLMKVIAKYRKEGTIVATNTSGVSINTIVSEMDLSFKQDFIGTHFFNPPRYMKLIEIIPCDYTKPELIGFMADFAEKMLGKGVVIAKDTPNFIANRVGVQSMSSVMSLAEKFGYSIVKTDLLTGSIIGRPKTGTFRLADLVGIDILLHVANNVLKNTDNQYEIESNTIPDYVKDLVVRGYLGDKTSSGFYKNVRSVTGQKRMVWNYKVQDYVELKPLVVEAITAAKESKTLKDQINAMAWGKARENIFVWEVLKSTLLYAANNVPDIADDFRDIDKAVRWGFNWELGPFEVWDAIGVVASVERMEAEGNEVPLWVKDRINQGTTSFYNKENISFPYIWLRDKNKYPLIIENDGAALIDIGNDVACLEFKTRGNTIDNNLIEMLSIAVKTVEEGNYKGLVIGNHNKNFSPGANLMMVAEIALAKDWNKLEKLIFGLQNATMTIKYAKKPVVTCPHGMTLGGGAEIAMSGYRQVAHAETYMGLVELGVGLVPGGGGTKEILWRYTGDLGNCTMSERIYHLKAGWEMIAMAKVSSSAHDALNKKYLSLSDRIVMNQDYLVDEAKKEVIHLYDSGFRPKLKKDIAVTGSTGRAVLQNVVSFMREGGFISEYDGYLVDKVAYILTGGNVVPGAMMSEDMILDLEREVFISLCGEKKTQERIDYMLKKGKPLRN